MKECGKMKLLKKAFIGMGKRAKKVLLIGLPVILAELIFVSSMLVCANGSELVALIHIFPLMLENILLSLVLLVGGAILFDFCEKESKEKY